MDLTLCPLAKQDRELSAVQKMHDEPSTAKYISVGDGYFAYVTGTENVVYFKIMLREELVGGIHTEISGATLYLSICIQPKYRKKGLASAAVKMLLSQLAPDVERVQVSVDETNKASIRLFESLGFTKTGQEAELADYILDLKA